MTIEIRIDELLLHGFAPLDRARLRAALERELAALIAERGLSGRPAGAEAQLAAEIAAALYHTISVRPQLRVGAGASVPPRPSSVAPLPPRGGAGGEVT